MKQLPQNKTENLRVMIVEDEPPMLRFLSRLLSQTEGFSVVSQCTGAEEALALLKTADVDLLISDIRMSGMSGLQLAEEARRFSPHMHIIIVTGYKSFEYAKTAVPLNIDAFITKPIDQNEFQEVLSQIRDTFRRNRLFRVRALLEQAFAHNDQAQFAQLLSHQGCSPCQVLLVYYPGDHSLLLASAKRARDSLLYLRYQGALLFFLPEESAEEMIRYITVKFSREPLQPATGICVHIAYSGEPVPAIEDLRDIYRNQVLKMIVPGSFVCYTSLMLKAQLDRTALYTKDNSLCQEIEASLFSRKREMAWQQLEQLFSLWKKDRMPLSHLRRRIHSLAALWAKSGTLSADSFSLNEQIDESISGLDSYEEILACLTRILQAHSDVGEAPGSREPELFDRIKALALKDLSRNYSLQEICGIFQVSQPYVRKIFLKYTGETYNDFISGEKIRHAVRLLEDNPQIPIKDLAASLGYEQFYFSTVFKKNIGVTPSQYRQSVLNRT